MPIILTKQTIIDKKRHVHILMVQAEYVNSSDYGHGVNDDIDDVDNSMNSRLLDSEKYHYCQITNLSKLVRAQLTKHKAKIWICDRCLHYFCNESKLNLHTVDCTLVNKCKVKLPSLDEKWLCFKNFGYKSKHPFIIYADTESILEPINEESDQKRTTRYQHHKVHSIG